MDRKNHEIGKKSTPIKSNNIKDTDSGNECVQPVVEVVRTLNFFNVILKLK